MRAIFNLPDPSFVELVNLCSNNGAIKMVTLRVWVGRGVARDPGEELPRVERARLAWQGAGSGTGDEHMYRTAPHD